MDMLTKSRSNFIQIKLTKYYISDDKYIEFPNQPPIITFDLNSENKFLGNQVFSFNEYDRVEIEFISMDSNDRLDIESYYSNDDSHINNDELLKKIKPGYKILISPGGDIDDMLVPGSYEINIKHNNIYYNGFYTINPSTSKINTLLNMREYIEDKVKGLAYNIYSERKVSWEFSQNINEVLMEKYRYINETKHILIGSLDFIIKNPISSIEKTYKYCNNSNKVTNKSQRWMCGKGNKYNNNIYLPNTFYEKRTIVSDDTNENRILKYMIEQIYNIMIDLLSQYYSIENKIKKDIEDIRIRINDADNKLNILRQNKNISKSFIDSKYRDRKGLSKLLESNNEKLNQIKMCISNINTIKSNINYYLRESWLSSIEKSKNDMPTSKLIKDKYYNEIYRVYEYLKGSNIDGKEKKSFPYKKTSRLYEVYNFLLIQEILESIGFKWTSGWLKDKSDILSYNGDLNSGDYIILQNNKYKVKMIYDNQVMRSDDLAANKTEISQISANQNTRSTRPDILIEFYEDDKLLKAIIVEVKYRKLNYIYNSIGNTKVDEQLYEYMKLEYYSGKTKKVKSRSPITKVIAIYPKQRNARKIVHNTYGDIIFLPVMISEEDKRSHEGFDELKSEILEVIEGCFDIDLWASATIEAESIYDSL